MLYEVITIETDEERDGLSGVGRDTHDIRGAQHIPQQFPLMVDGCCQGVAFELPDVV